MLHIELDTRCPRCDGTLRLQMFNPSNLWECEDCQSTWTFEELKAEKDSPRCEECGALFPSGAADCDHCGAAYSCAQGETKNFL